MTVKIDSRHGYSFAAAALVAIPWGLHGVTRVQAPAPPALLNLARGLAPPGAPDEGYAWLAVITGVCAAACFYCLTRVVRYQRTISNIPTSTIRGMAMGLVEIKGRARKAPPLTSPISGRPCVYFEYEIEERQRKGKRETWVAILSGSSRSVPFVLDDGTGTALVDPSKAEIDGLSNVTAEYGGLLHDDIPESLQQFLESHGRRVTGPFGGSRHLRFGDSVIDPGTALYVIGDTRVAQPDGNERRRLLAERLRPVKADPKAMAAADLDRDGRIDDAEWATVVASVEERLLEEELQRADPAPSVVVGQGELNLISTESERDLLWAYRLGAGACLVGLALDVALLGTQLSALGR